MRKLIKNHFWITVLLLVFLIVRFIYAFKFHDISWDEGVYLSMGKYLYSAGSVGLWEIIRPVVMPLIFGFFWFIGVPYVFAAEMIEIMFGAGVLLLVYLIGMKIWNKEAGIFASLLLAITPVFFLYTGYFLTGIPSIFFVLLGVYLFLENKILLSGIFFGLAAITRFPVGLFFAVMFFVLLYYKKKKSLITLVKGFFIPVALFLIFNYAMYHKVTSKLWHALFRPWILAFGHQLNPAEFVDQGFFYGVMLINDNFLLLLVLLGLGFYFFKPNLNKAIVTFSFLVPFVYFSIIPNKQIRFALSFLPFLVLLASGGLWEFCDRFKAKKRVWQTIVGITFILLLIYVVPVDKGYYDWRGEAPEVVTHFYPLLEEVPAGVILTADPVAAAYVDRSFVPYYFSLAVAEQVMKEEKDNAAAILHISDAFFCTEGDHACLEQVKAFDTSVGEGMELKAESSYGERTYYLFTS